MMSSTASATSNTPSEIETPLKRKSNDVGWEYGILADPSNLDRVKCKLCGKVMSGGVRRMKEHIGHIQGNVVSCTKASQDDQAKCINAINEVKDKKKKLKKQEEDLIASVNINGLEEYCIEEDELRESIGSMKPPRSLGAMDKFATCINPQASLNVAKTTREQNIHDALWKERSNTVKNYVADWIYEADISFNAFDLESFRLFTEALGQFGPRWKPPSQYELREPLLKKAIERTKVKVKPHEDEWGKNGCSLMTDAWSDRKRRSIMNLCVNSKIGTVFLSSKESSDVAHTSEMIFEYVDQCIEKVGPNNVIQVVTDNASNNMGAAKLLRVKRPTIFWTSCATHTINLVLEGIAKLPRFKKIIDQAKALTIFIYAHHKTLAMMRSYTKRRDIVKPGVTRFASSFLSLQSLVEKKAQLKTMFSSSEWDECKWSKTVKGQAIFSFFFHLQIHTKKRNRLDVSRLNNLVYVQFNSRLLNKRKRGKEKDVDVLLASDASKAQDWIIPGLYDDEDELGDGIDGDASRVRELEEDDFESEDEEEVNENDFEFESDEERVLENYGEEEEDPFGIATF